MKRKSVMMMALAATMMVAAFPVYAAVKAEAKPERVAVAVKAEAKPERAQAVAMQMQMQMGPDTNEPEIPEVPVV
ncbi:hypothetical protein [Paenibacillus kobensis]|uniref:hypothetical protein n=1 Tax=Paenibacillus kobensis TaxID=59841 RepID=UPI000FD6C8FD|nr:hypothetical protein [Paenibacillus kobensis]